eukprot:129830_1
MTKLYRDALIRHIKSSECIQDIVALIGMIGFSKIQTFLRQQILELNDNDVRKVYFNSLSMNDTLPSDIVGHVLSFNTFQHNNAIKETNKQWNTHSTQIKAMQNKERKQVVDKYPIQYNEVVNNVWIVDQNRSQLTNDEIVANVKGCLSDVATAIELCESGDKLLIHDGIYEVSPIKIDKSIQIVGIGDNVVLKNGIDYDESTLSFRNNSTSYIENIAFAVDNNECVVDGHIDIGPNATVTVNKCKFDNGVVGINCGEGARLDAKSCEFVKCSFGIYAMPTAVNINVIGCTFEECGYTEDHSTYSVVHVQRTNIGKHPLYLRCIGNVFQNNLSFPFVKLCELDEWNTYSLRYNMLDGDKGILMDAELVDANTMYREDHKATINNNQ